MKRAFCIFGLAWLAWGGSPDFDRAYKLYNLTEFQQSLEVLRAVPNKDAALYELMGRNYYGLGDFKKATEQVYHSAAEPSGVQVMVLPQP